MCVKSETVLSQKKDTTDYKILQNKFPRFDDAVVKWKFKDESCTADLLEKKIFTNYTNKIYKTDASGTITYDEEHHATNIAPLDFSITKGVVSIMFTFLLMFFLFKNLADSYAKNGGCLLYTSDAADE